MGLLKTHRTVKSLVKESHREILSGVKSVHFCKVDIDLEVLIFVFSLYDGFSFLVVQYINSLHFLYTNSQVDFCMIIH